jgi:hypothetical protein
MEKERPEGRRGSGGERKTGEERRRESAELQQLWPTSAALSSLSFYYTLALSHFPFV